MNPQPFNTGYLPEENGHKVFFSQYGNVDGPAVVRLHGGPGSKSKPKHAAEFDLSKYQVITFDQRGCGLSEPAGELANNTLPKLISDMERLRTELKLDSWFVAGSSWGGGLALAYAQAHPDKVKGFLLSSIFLARPRDDAWAFSTNAGSGIERLFPDVWEKRQAFLEQLAIEPAQASKQLLAKLLTGSLEVQRQITAGVANWENNLMNAQSDISYLHPDEVDEEDIIGVKIFLHYQVNNFFLEPDQLLRDLPKIKSIPAILLHGRYDVLCPAEAMWAVQKGLDNVETYILPTSNHKLTADGEVARFIAYKSFLKRYA